ncbi:MAG: hypothetical protein J6I60_07200 [Bacteroidaceae bacterium]|nr:hypothetical protein [Bacteroidaceae bacterium]
MLWSSFKNNRYCIGQAISTTGKIAGPWRQSDVLLYEAHGSHGMLFHTFDARLMLTLHGPNTPPGTERAQLVELIDAGDCLKPAK